MKDWKISGIAARPLSPCMGGPHGKTGTKQNQIIQKNTNTLTQGKSGKKNPQKLTEQWEKPLENLTRVCFRHFKYIESPQEIEDMDKFEDELMMIT